MKDAGRRCVVDLGVQLFPKAAIRTLIALARRAEALGYRAAWVGDEGFGQDPYVALTAIAAETTTIRLGPGITNPYTRHPAVTAVAIASLDAYAGGRAFLGLGAGGMLTLTAMDVARQRPCTRAARPSPSAGPCGGTRPSPTRAAPSGSPAPA